MQPLIAIDPGKNGAIALRTRDGDCNIFNMPDTPKDLFERLANIAGWARHLPGELEPPPKINLSAILERVGPMPHDGKASLAKFMKHVGHLEMALIAAGIPFEEITPAQWQKRMGALPKDKAERKRAIKDRMQRRYPHLRVTLQNADALAMLTYCGDK